MKLLFSIILLWVACAACGVKPVATASRSAEGTRIVEAIQQKTLPGARGAKPYTQYKLTLVWKEANAPYNFLWKGEQDWYSCRFDITKGDTVFVYANKQTAAPKDITAQSQNTLYYSTQNTSWKALEASSVKKLPDVIMP